MTEDDLAFLSPNFDPAKLTKPQLRSLLGDYGVTDLPPANAKKEVLLELFEARIRAKAGEIRRAKQGVKANSKGITFLDNQSRPSPKPSPKPSSVASPTRSSRSRSPFKSPTRISPRSPVRLSPSPKRAVDSLPEAPKTRGRPKKVEEPTKLPRARSKSKVKPIPSRLSTPLKALSDSLPGVSDTPISATLKLQQRLGYIASTNNMTLAEEAIIQPVYADSPSKRPGVPSKVTTRFAQRLGGLLLVLLKFAIAFVMTIVLAMYLRWKYVYPIPYCDTSAPPKPFYPEVDLMTSLKNLCLKCPDNGICNRGKLACADGHIRTANWLWLGETCKPDWQRFSKAEELVKTIKRVLRERQGSFQCKQCPTPTVTESALKATLGSQRFKRASWAGEDFDSYYKLALMDLMKDPDHHGIKIMGGSEQRLFLSSMAIFSWKCQAYILVTQFYESYRWYIIGTIVGAVGCVYFYIKLKTGRWERRKVEELVQTVLQCLAEQDALNRRDPTRPSTLSVPQLRDALFMNASVAEKTRLWPKVCATIANNSNVRESVMSIKGEQHRVWEWIGIDVLAPFTKLSSN